jgi:hypothetical protein
LGARDREHLRQRCEDASALLGWPAPYLDHDPLPNRVHAARPCFAPLDEPSAETSAV